MNDMQEKDSRTNGRWTKAEHQKFMLGLELYGKNWKKIQQLVGTRTGSQIRSHAQKYFLKSPKQTQNHQNSQPTSQQVQLLPPSSVISNTNQNNQESQSQYSYFMNKIIKVTQQNSDINFWEAFIDIKCSKMETIQGEPQHENKRKDSFVMCDLYGDSKQETAFTHCNWNLVGDQIIM